MIEGQGFQQVFSMAGGIRAWEGLTAEGPPDLGLHLIKGNETPVEMAELAYGLEKGLGRFYRVMRERSVDGEISDLFDRLSGFEDRHGKMILELHRDLAPGPEAEEELDRRISGRIMEGGATVDDYLWKYSEAFKSREEVLDLALSLEAQGLDLYLRFARNVSDPGTREIVHRIGEEEKTHLAALGKMLGRKT